MIVGTVTFPEFTGLRCLMMPYVQGDPDSVPQEYQNYADIIRSTWIEKGDIGFLTIDESLALKGTPHRGDRAKFNRALHTEAGKCPGTDCCGWGGSVWGSSHHVKLDRNVKILLANNLDDSCAVWKATHEDTSLDGDIGYAADQYPYSDAVFVKASEVHQIGILTPHESIPVRHDVQRQFLRIVSSGVYGREQYFTENPLMSV